MSRMLVTLSVSVAGSNVELGCSSLTGQSSESLCLLEAFNWSGVDSKDIFVVGERRGRLVKGTVAAAKLSEAFRRTLTTTWSKHKLSACAKHHDKPATCLYVGPLNPTTKQSLTNCSTNSTPAS